MDLLDARDLYWVVDACGFKRWPLPLAVVGANSIAIYLMSQLMRPFVEASLKTHVDKLIFVGPYGPLVKGLCILTVLWFYSRVALPPQDLHQDLMSDAPTPPARSAINAC